MGQKVSRIQDWDQNRVDKKFKKDKALLSECLRK